MVEIEYNGEIFSVIHGYLDLEYRFINDISDIKGLDSITNLEELNLCSNQITEIKGLENIPSLKKLYLNNNLISEIKGLDCLYNLEELSLQYNNIMEIRGLENLVNLKMLYIEGNPIPHDIIEMLGGISSKGGANNPQRFIDFCSEIQVIGLEDIEIQGPMKDLAPIPFGIDTESFDRESERLLEIEREKINTILISIQDLLSQHDYIEALDLLNGAKKIALNNDLIDILDEIVVKMHGIKLQRINFHVDEALSIFSNSYRCSIQDINEFLSSVSPDFNFTEKKLKYKILYRLKQLKMNAIMDDNYIIFNTQLDQIQDNYSPSNQMPVSNNEISEPMTRMRKYCINCGEKIDADSRICSYCGVFQDSYT